MQNQNKEKKQVVIDEFVQVFGESGFYILDFKGLNVAEVTELRSKLRNSNVSMRVVKNTLALRALSEAGISDDVLNEYFNGPTSIVWSKDDPIAPAKIMLESIKELKKGAIKCGYVDGLVVKDNEIERLAEMPGKQEHYAMIASALKNPIVSFARVLNATPQKFVRTIDALREQKEKDEQAA